MVPPRRKAPSKYDFGVLHSREGVGGKSYAHFTPTDRDWKPVKRDALRKTMNQLRPVPDSLNIPGIRDKMERIFDQLARVCHQTISVEPAGKMTREDLIGFYIQETGHNLQSIGIPSGKRVARKYVENLEKSWKRVRDKEIEKRMKK